VAKKTRKNRNPLLTIHERKQSCEICYSLRGRNGALSTLIGVVNCSTTNISRSQYTQKYAG